MRGKTPPSPSNLDSLDHDDVPNAIRQELSAGSQNPPNGVPALMQTGLVAGVAPGAIFSGLVIDAHGASTAFLVCVAAGVIAALAAQTLPRTE